MISERGGNQRYEKKNIIPANAEAESSRIPIPSPDRNTSILPVSGCNNI